MLISLKKWFAFVYWSLKELFKNIFDDGWSGFKAEAVIMFGELGAIVFVLNAMAIFLRHQVMTTGRAYYPVALATCGAVIAINRVALRDWKRFEAQFRRYPPRVRIGGGIAAGLVPVALVALGCLSTSLALHLPRLP